jgi:hypothetical protein
MPAAEAVVARRPDRWPAAQEKLPRRLDRPTLAAVVARRPDRQQVAAEAAGRRLDLLAAVAPDRAMPQRAAVQRAQAPVRRRLRPRGTARRHPQTAQ